VITRTVKLQLLAFLAITVLGVAYAGSTYVGLGRVLLHRAYTVTAVLPESGGIFTNAEVTERGVRVGRVSGLHLAPGGVAVELQLDAGTRIPADTDAVVTNLSAVGEQYVDLRPRRDAGPYLRAGSVIPRERTRVPLRPEVLLTNLDQLVASVDRRHLSTLVGELGDAFGGSGADLQRIIDSGDRLTETMTEALPQTVSLIDHGRTVLDTQRAVAGDLKTWARGLRQLSATVRDDDPQLRAVFDRGIVSADEVRTLLRENSSVLPVLLDNLIAVGRIQAVPVRLDGLRTILTVYPENVYNGFNVVPAGTSASRFGLVTDQQPPPCQTYASSRSAPGYVPPADRRSGAGRDPAHDYGGAAKLNAYCLLPHGSASDVRGARNAPRPAGDDTDRPPYQPDGQPSVAHGAVAHGVPVTGGSGSSLPRSERAVAPYDPVTGLLALPDGQEMIIGDDGGQQRLLGADSWRWLLLAPLGAPLGR
jgi:phospholipid/cholesterol/gamma-HCH transport system substrate-binding protein